MADAWDASSEKGKDAESTGLPVPALPRGGTKMYTTWPEMIRHWPKTTFCIVSSEFCERFSYYGMSTVLTFYLLNVLKFDEDTTTVFFNSFTVVCYLTPILGSIVADGYIGKFWTIFIVSIIYAAGQVVLAVAAVQKSQSSVHPWMDLLGLLIIAIGTGGIKPCVAPFGADQFDRGQERMMSVYFSMFYFSINAGAMISSFLTPIFRAQPCLGQDSCYPLAFGVPAILMIAAAALFMAGSFWYKKPKPTENVFAEVFKILFRAAYNKFSSHNAGPTEHWLDHYMDTHDCNTDPRCMALQGTKKKNKCQKSTYVDDIKALLRVLVMFIPVPMFFALYDQQGSVWLIQGIQMNCNIFGSFLLLPDQMRTLNAVLILVFIPLFQVVVYPLCNKCFEMTPLRRMVAGGWLTALTYVVAGLVQLEVNKTLPQLPDQTHSFVSFMNVWDDTCNFTITPMGDGDKSTLNPYMLGANMSMIDIKEQKYSFHINQGSSTFKLNYGDGCTGTAKFDQLAELTYDFKGGKVYEVAVGPLGAFYREVETAKPTQGTGEFKIGITLMTDKTYDYNIALCRYTKEDDEHPCNPQKLDDFQYWETDYDGHTDDRKDPVHIDGSKDNITALPYVFKDIKPGKYKLYYLNNVPRDYDQRTYAADATNVTDMKMDPIEINGQGGVYSLVITGPGYDYDATQKHSVHVYTVVQDNKVSIAWQIPQFVIITAAEILFSISGLEFAYSQSAPSMKTVVQACWLLTTSIGDGIIVLIALFGAFDDMALEFFVYAAAMFIVICIFALMAHFYYEYNYYTSAEKDEEEDDDGTTEEEGSNEETWGAGGYDNKDYHKHADIGDDEDEYDRF